MAKDTFSNFKNQLWTTIISCPILYINHFHYQYVDDALREVLQENSISTDSILEFDYGLGTVVSFESKSKDTCLKEFRCANDILCKLLLDHEELTSDIFSDNSVQKRIFLFKDLKGLNQERDDFDYKMVSLLKSFATKYEMGKYDDLTTIIIVAPEEVSELPLTLRNYITVLEILPPSVDEIRQIVIDAVGAETYNNNVVAKDLVRTLQGLQLYEVRQTLRTVFAMGKLKRSSLKIALEEKQRIVKKSGIIEVVNPDVSFDDVGGLNVLHDDLNLKKDIFHHLDEVEKYHITMPKGVLIIGMPGCGKSMIAKATASLFEVSLLRLDVSRLMGKYVGESEANLRLALATAEAAHPCVLWIDEIEKAFAGSNNSGGDNDMLIMRMMGHFLTWMQERKTPVYIVATANDVMRPEFMRKGRFDEVYFVDFPTADERADILKKKIDKQFKGNNLLDFSEIGDCKEVVKNMKGEYGGFSGSEIECVLNMVVEEKFSEYLKKNQNLENKNKTPEKVIVKKEDFNRAIDRIKKTVMANQKSEKQDEKDVLRNKTAIERIRDMKDKFTPASRNTK